MSYSDIIIGINMELEKLMLDRHALNKVYYIVSIIYELICVLLILFLILPFLLSMGFDVNPYSEPYISNIIRLEKSLFILMFLFLFFLFFIKISTHSLKLNIPILTILVFFLIIFISTLLNNKNLSYDIYTKLNLCDMVMYGLFLFCFSKNVSESSFRRVINICGISFLLILFVYCYYSLYVYASGRFEETVVLFGKTIIFPGLQNRPGIINPNGRYAGIFSNTGTLGVTCLAGICLSFYFVLSVKNLFAKVFFLVSLLGNSLMILLANSRTGLITIFFVLLFFLIEVGYKHHLKHPVGYPILLFVCLTLIAIFFRRDSIISFLHLLLKDPYQTIDHLSSGRIAIFKEILTKVSNNPILGCGWNASIYLGKVEFISAHNVFFSIFYCGGILGLFLFLVFMVSSIINIINHKNLIRDNIGLFCILFCVFVQSLTEQGIFLARHQAGTIFFWLILGYFVNAEDHIGISSSAEKKASIDEVAIGANRL